MSSVSLMKSEDFAVRIVEQYKVLEERKTPMPLTTQIIRSGTSIAANLYEADCAFSSRDFLSKVYISLKECNETRFWLRLLYRTSYLQEAEYESLIKEADEIKKILSATTSTMRKRLNKK